MYRYEIAWIGIKDVSYPTPILYIDYSTENGFFPSCPCVPPPNIHPDIRDCVESYVIHMILTRRLRITLVALILSLIISKQRVPSSVPLLLTEETPLLIFLPLLQVCLGHFEFKTLLMSSSVFSKRPIFFCTRPSNWLYVRNRYKRVFLGPRIFCILQIFKPPFERLGSYKFCQSLLSRNSCWVLDSGNTPK